MESVLTEVVSCRPVGHAVVAKSRQCPKFGMERGCVKDQPQQFGALRLTLRAQPRSVNLKQNTTKSP